MKNLSIKAIFLGGIVSVVGSLVTSFLVNLLFGVVLAQFQMPALVTEALMMSPASNAIHMMIAAAATVCGGFVAAETAMRRPLSNGTLSAWGMMLLSPYYFWVLANPVFAGFCILAPILGFLGGWLKRG